MLRKFFSLSLIPSESILSSAPSHPARNIHTKGCWTHAAQTIRAFYRHTHSSHSTKCKLSSDRDSERPLYFDSCRQNAADKRRRRVKQVARAPQKHCIDGFVPSKIINKCQICQLTQNLFLQTKKAEFCRQRSRW